MDALSRLGLRRRRLAVAVACVGFGIGSLPAQAGGNPSPPTLAVRSVIVGTDTPPLVAGQWSKQPYGWSIDISAMAVPGGTTTIESHWTSSTFRVVRHETFFQTDAVVSHQGVPDGFTFDESARICVRNDCDPWFDFGTMDAQNFVDPESLPFTVETGHGLFFRWSSRPALVRVEWRYTQAESVADCVWTSIHIGVGKNATRSRQPAATATNPVVAGCGTATLAAA